MYILNGKKFNANVQHVIGDIQYPAGWFLDAGNRASLPGLVEVPDPVRPNPTLVDFTENEDGSYTTTPRDPIVIAQENAARDDALARAALIEIDKDSVRSMREFMIAKFGNDTLMPSQLQDAEAAAQAERLKVTPK